MMPGYLQIKLDVTGDGKDGPFDAKDLYASMRACLAGWIRQLRTLRKGCMIVRLFLVPELTETPVESTRNQNISHIY